MDYKEQKKKLKLIARALAICDKEFLEFNITFKNNPTSKKFAYSLNVKQGKKQLVHIFGKDKLEYGKSQCILPKDVPFLFFNELQLNINEVFNRFLSIEHTPIKVSEFKTKIDKLLFDCIGSIKRQNGGK